MAANASPDDDQELAGEAPLLASAAILPDLAIVQSFGGTWQIASNATLDLAGNSNTVTVNGSLSGVILSGSLETVLVNGSNDTLSVIGANEALTMNGGYESATLSGSVSSLIVNGNNASLTISGTGNGVQANGTLDTVLDNASSSSLAIASGAVTVGDNVAQSTINGQQDAIVLGNNDGITVSGPSMNVTLSGAGGTLHLLGNSEILQIGTAASANGIELDGQSSTIILAGGSDTLTVNGTGNTLSVSGGNNALFVNGASGNAVTLGSTANVLNTVNTAVTFLNNSTGTVNGGANMVAVGSGDSVTVSGAGGSATMTGTNSTVGFQGDYGTITLLGSGNTANVAGNDDNVVIAGASNSASINGVGVWIEVSGASQDLKANGATVQVNAGAKLVMDGTNHNSTGAPDFGNGNMVAAAAGVALTITGSQNAVQLSAGDAVIFSDVQNDITASGIDNAVTLDAGSTDDLLQMSGSLLVLNAGASATLIGSNDTVQMSGGTLVVSSPVALASEVFKVQGFADDSYTNGEFESTASDSSLAQLRATGANSVELVVTQYIPEPGGGSETGNTIVATTNTESNASLIHAIQQAEADGLQVFLKPHIDPSDGTWRALIDPSSPATFFANYEAFILNYATIAEQTGVSMLSLGSELESMTGAKYLSEWTAIIAAVRQVAPDVKLTYASAYDELGTVSFWSQLDVIATNPYEATTNSADPTVAQLVVGWNSVSSDPAFDSESPIAFYSQIAAQYGKSILFTEIGYRSVNGSDLLNGNSAAYIGSGPDDNAQTVFNGNYPYPDYNEQSTALQALFDAFAPYGSTWLDGMYLWEWNPNPANVVADDFSVQDKPALNVVEQEFTPNADPAPSGATVMMSGAGNSVTLSGSAQLQISGFAAGDSIVASGLIVTDAFYASGILTLYNGQSALATVALTGTYTAMNFAAGPAAGGGSLITLLTPSADMAKLADTPSTDFNGDGRSDLLLQSSDGNTAIWEMNGLSAFAGAVVGNPGTFWNAVGSGDFNGDGHADLLWQAADGTVAIWQMNGTAIVLGAVLAAPGPTWHAVATGDFNGGGNAGIVLQNDNGSVAVWDIANDMITGGAIVANPGTAWQVMGTGDFYGNGTSDILLQNDDGTVGIWQMNDTAIAGGVVVANPGTAWHVVGTGDFNNDGMSDIVLQNNDGTVAVWNTNDGVITNSAIVADPGTGWHVKATGDFNGDGASDILLQNNDGSVAIWQMNATTIAVSAVVGAPGPTWDVMGTDQMHFIDGTTGTGTLNGTILNDVFEFPTSQAGLHVIAGFDPAHDMIALNAAQFGSFAGLAPHETTSGGASIIDLGNGSTLSIMGVPAISLSARNFMFQ